MKDQFFAANNHKQTGTADETEVFGRILEWMKKSSKVVVIMMMMMMMRATIH